MQLCESVVIVNDFAKINGGAARVAVSSAVALAEAGKKVIFFSAVGPPEPSLISAGVHVICLDHLPYNRSPHRFKAAMAGMWDREAADSLRAVLSELDPKHTVVHAHTFRDALSASVPSMALKMGFSTLYTAHEYTMGCPYGSFYDHKREHACQLHGLSARCLTTSCGEGSYVKKLWFASSHAVYQKAATLPRRFNRAFFVSERSQQILQSYVGPLVRQEVLRNPIQISREPRAMIGDDSPFIFVGALNAFKDPVTLARAAKLADVPATFVGEGPLKGAIELANPNAELTGWLGGDEVTERLRRSRAVVMTSLGYETFGLAVAEGAASGIGSIVTDVSVASAWATQTGSGLVYRAKDAEDLAAKLTELKDGAKANKFGQRAYDAYWSDPPTMAAHLNQLLSAYEAELALKT